MIDIGGVLREHGQVSTGLLAVALLGEAFVDWRRGGKDAKFKGGLGGLCVLVAWGWDPKLPTRGMELVAVIFLAGLAWKYARLLYDKFRG